MDPLSVAASVAGLVSLAGQLVPTLYNLGLTVKEANKDAQAAAVEVAAMSVVLQGLQGYIIGRSKANPRRLQLITVEHITASLTACVFTYSELDAVLKDLHADTGLKAWDRAIWFIKRDSIQDLVLKIQNHKLTFSCMLNILQCDSAGEAERNMDRLCGQVNLLLSVNKELSARLRNLEHISRPGSPKRSVTATSNNSIRQSHKSLSVRSMPSALSPAPSLGSPQSEVSLFPEPVVPKLAHIEPANASAFEEQLHRSRVYRHAQANHSESSLLDDGLSTLALSICSSLTLGEVSNISVFALPVFANELSNAAAYDFARTTGVISLGGPTPTELHTGDDAQRELVDERKTLSKYIRTRLALGRSNPKEPRRLQKKVSGTFGVPLYISVRYANAAISLLNEDGTSCIFGYIPIVLAKTCVYLKEKGTDVENVFATGSSPSRVRELQSLFDKPDRYGRDLVWSGYTVHDAANTLLRYLLKLPEPVIPLEYYVRFRSPLQDHQNATSVGDDGQSTHSREVFSRETTIQTYKTLLSEIPPLNKQVLLYLLDMLALFASKSKTNKMNASRLAAIFQQAILSHHYHMSSIAERQLSQRALRFLIKAHDEFEFGIPKTAVSRMMVDKVQSGSMGLDQTPPSPITIGIGGSGSSKAVGADSILLASNASQGLLSNISGSSADAQAPRLASRSHDSELERPSNSRNNARLDDTSEQSIEAASPANHLDWRPESLPDIVL